MMKVVLILAVFCGISAGYSIPMRNALMYYRQAMPFYMPYPMYGYQFQNQQLQNQRRSSGVATFAAGNRVATGTFLKDVESTEEEHGIQAAADAYPGEQFPVEDEVPGFSDQESDEPIAEEPVALPVAPVAVPDKKKKVTVQLDSEEDEEEVEVSRRGAGRPAPPSHMFPINFGSTNGGAIAIANSYSTGKGGSAQSTATAYGSPAAAELRKPAVGQLRKKPVKLRAVRKY
ncbi:uncharacterized protein LOC129759232 isoform X2 [Uranotaenia lowii]|uniref:uncharacterized protein LOC129759203 isoform X2 n=1 Tax=Uranotaenia lowii TaxID=190385 RepID=UPI002479D412|nr:uncharacterized protein LOC129759203 isoform X2 [Uranotaenia lowii]XP_055612612.1 uncharacterized protein LOC129759232 isoform X2 [Uranotaenia lowii]